MNMDVARPDGSIENWSTEHGKKVISTGGKRDEDIAAELKAELRPHLEAIVALQNKAAGHGMQIGFQLARDQYGRNFVQTIDVVKPL
jgi:hypothetical protein